MANKLAYLAAIKKKLKKLIVLDLDNTCICSVELNQLHTVPHPESFRHVDIEGLYRVYERPGLQEFLDVIFKEYEVAVWTAAGYDYACFIIEHFITMNRKERVLQFVLWDQHCDYSEKNGSQTKDLSLLTPLYNHFILLDDNQDVLKQPNVLDSKDFDVSHKKAKDDCFFKKTIPYLESYFKK